MHQSEYERRKEEARHRWLQKLEEQRRERLRERQEELENEVKELIAEAENARDKLGPVYRLASNWELVNQSLGLIGDESQLSTEYQAHLLLGSLKSVLLDPAIGHVSKRFQEGFGVGATRVLTDLVVEPPAWPPIQADHPFIPSLYGTMHPLHKQALIELMRAAHEDRFTIATESVDGTNKERGIFHFSPSEAQSLFQYVGELVCYGLALIENDFVRKARRPQEYYASEIKAVDQEFNEMHFFPWEIN
jgi:hypothetical protein